MRIALLSAMYTVRAALTIGLSSARDWYLRERWRLLMHTPRGRRIRTYTEIERAIVQIAAVIGYSAGDDYSLLRRACLVVSSHYPEPTARVLERLVVDIAENAPTTLAFDFYREYCSKEQA